MYIMETRGYNMQVAFTCSIFFRDAMPVEHASFTPQIPSNALELCKNSTQIFFLDVGIKYI